MSASYSLAEVSEELNLPPARIVRLIEAGALPTDSAPGEPLRVPRSAVNELCRRGTVRALETAAIEVAVDRALRRRLGPMLDELQETTTARAAELAAALAQGFAQAREESLAQRVEAERRAGLAEAELQQSRERVRLLAARVEDLQRSRGGVFRRRRRRRHSEVAAI